jgi:NAD(P)-dependent dehydrogenase (short-subunit alcohol dehydrogenase family)
MKNNWEKNMSNTSIKGSVLFVTGANRGIGRAIVQEALKRGATKIYAGARDISTLKDLSEQSLGKIIPVEIDVTNRDQIEKAAQKAQDTQILINNAGVVSWSGFIYDYSEESARQELEVNYFGPLNVTRAFAETLINKHGAVANVLSGAGLSIFPVAATYSASKAAGHLLTQGLRAELTPQSVSVFGIYPGPIDTDMTAGLDMEMETPENVAIRIFDGMEAGQEDITTDKFADEFVRNLKNDAKALEKEFGHMAHKPQAA